MATILALDTSTEACSCALSINGVVTEHFEVSPRQHAQKILPMIQALMSKHDLVFAQIDAIAFGRGPGSFTGLRIAAGVTQGIAFAAELPVIPVSTLAAIALDVRQQATQTSHVLSCLDARIDEVYWGLFGFENDMPVLLDQEFLCKPERMNSSVVGRLATLASGGNGLEFTARFPALIRDKINISLPELLPRAGQIARIAASLWDKKVFITADEITPVYLRDQVTSN
ncbi:MAG: tRNA (adenosine(37)-N6)-threonylcarbamoyltransferase complex dimerization subunit type 1 TsaB [Pseudomonadota bacterium]